MVRAVLEIFHFHLYLFDLRPWTSEPARLSKLRDLVFWSCSTRPVELNPLSHFSSSASTYLHVHVHVHIRFYFIYLLSYLGVFSRFSSLSNLSIYRFLTFLALASRLLLILGFDMEFFHSHKHHTGSDLCLSFPRSVSVLSLSSALSPASLYFVIAPWYWCSLLSLIVLLLPFVHPLHVLFILLLPFPLISFSCVLTTAFLCIYRKMVNVIVRLPFNLHGRSMSSKSCSYSCSRQDPRFLLSSSAPSSVEAERPSQTSNI